MGKKRGAPATHRQALGEQIENPASHGVRVFPRAAKKHRSIEDVDDAEKEQKLTAKILKQAKEQQVELQDEADREAAGPDAGIPDALAGRVTAALQQYDSDEGEEEWSDVEEGYMSDPEEISAEEAAKYDAFMRSDQGPAVGGASKTLADMILEKIGEKQAEKGLPAVVADDDAAMPLPELDPKVVHVYRSVGQLMSRFTTGKVPKAFKVIPHLKNWEEVLYITEPESWSPHAVFVGVRTFVSQLNPAAAQRFMNLVLLPRFRADIREHKRLHFALFQAMKKAVYKPGAFYKGILLPLCAAGDCTLREAVVMSSILSRVSIPVEHSAAALLRMADMEYAGTTSFFMRVLLDKKYALPYRVIDALVDHFTSFRHEARELPVVWHQTLLVFVQRYKHEIRAEDKDALKALMRAQCHHQVTPEIHRELDHSRNRGEKTDGKEAMKAKSRIGAGVTEDARKLPPVFIMDED